MKVKKELSPKRKNWHYKRKHSPKFKAQQRLVTVGCSGHENLTPAFIYVFTYTL